MNLRVGIILQARYASTRLRGKALAEIAGRSLLQRCLQRLMTTGVNRVVLATTTGPEDDELAEVAAREGAMVFRGDADDVLGRYAAAAERFALDPVLRATGDNPAVDPGAAARLLACLSASGADYVHEVGLPVGAALEAMSAPALHYAASVASRAHDREHVTTFIKSRPDIFRLRSLTAPRELTAPSLRLTVDTREDLEWVRSLFALAGTPQPSVAELIAAARSAEREVA